MIDSAVVDCPSRHDISTDRGARVDLVARRERFEGQKSPRSGLIHKEIEEKIVYKEVCSKILAFGHCNSKLLYIEVHPSQSTSSHSEQTIRYCSAAAL